jgi:hypothetical protein
MMHEDEQVARQEELQAMVVELEREGGRVGVDWNAAAPTLRSLAPVVERRVSDGEVEVGVSLDVMGMLATLRNLPDGVGTDAFLAAFRLQSAAGDPPLA